MLNFSLELLWSQNISLLIMSLIFVQELVTMDYILKHSKTLLTGIDKVIFIFEAGFLAFQR